MTKPKPRCPECKTLFATVQLLAMHRAKQHGVQGTSKSHLASVALRAKRAQEALPSPPSTNPLQCPECGEEFKKKTTLGLHRRNQHGIQGQAQGSIYARAKRDAYLANYKRDKDGSVICPECGTSWNDNGIAMHRKQVHGLSMEEQVRIFENTPKLVAIETVAETPAGDPAQCQHCDFKAINAHGLRKHMSAKHSLSTTPSAIYKRETRNKIIGHPTQAIAIAQTNGAIHAHQESHSASNGHSVIPEGTLALALGRFQGLCQSMAVEFDLPPRLFATRLAELIYHAQVR